MPLAPIRSIAVPINLAVLVALGPGGTVAWAQSPVVVVAVDAGSYIQPLARLVGGQWADAARAPSAASPREWTRWYTSGASVPVRIRAGDQQSSCAGTAVLVEQPPQLPANLADREHVGLAISGMLQAEAAQSVGRNTAEWRRIELAVSRLFEAREREQRLSGANVAQVPVVVDTVYATASVNSSQVYYFEASKRVPDNAADVDPDDPRGTIRVGVTGWLRRNGDAWVSLGTKGELHWDQVDERGRAPQRPDLTPLGIIRRDAEIVWVMKGQEGTAAWFTMYEVGGTRARELLQARAARC
jgi:hypothetical protein